MNYSITDEIDIYEQFTDLYKKWEHNKGKREIECMRIQYPLCMENIEDGDLIAGKGEFNQAIGFSPQPKCNKLGYFLNEDKAQEILNHPDIPANYREKFKQLVTFWTTEETTYKTRAAYPPEMVKALPSDNWTGEPGIAFPLYRMSGTQFNYRKLLTLGIEGLYNEVHEHLERSERDSAKQQLYKNMLEGLDLFTEVCLFYAHLISEKEKETTDANRRTELRTMHENVKHVSRKKPKTLWQAIQLSYLYCQFSGSQNFGRMDEYLGDFLVNDLQNGTLDNAAALNLIVNYWKTIEWRNRVYDSRLTLGGKGRVNEKNANTFAMLALEATAKANTVAPQITLRFYEGQDQALMDKALDVLGKGTTFPMLYNDDVNIPAVQNAFNISQQEAINYIPYGCGEYTIYHKSVGTPSGVINLPEALLVTLNNGCDPVTGNRTGLALGEPHNFNDFNSLWEAYQQQVEYFVEQLACQEKLEYDMAADAGPHIYFSLLYDDCISRGKAIYDGGVRYLGGTLETYGNTNVADSLVAIKQLVFEQQKLTLPELVTILKSNFTGYDLQRKWMLEAPKYGNDHNEADAMKVAVDKHVSITTRSMAPKVGLHSYLVVIINNDANTIMGRHTGATPDGRLQGTFLANANAASGGMDKSGVTALLNSLVKPDVNLHAGAVQNLKFSKELFTQHKPQLSALLSGYFSNGGAQAMITVINHQDLENALKNPAQYQNLIVRVGGFSARFVELPRDVQEEIVSRTLLK